MANEIIPGLWLGDEKSAKDSKFIKHAGIDVIINATKHIPNKFEKNNVEYIRIPINDPGPNVNPNQEDNLYLVRVLPDLVYVMDHYLNNNKNILVHCHAGRMRSASIVLCYLYKYRYRDGSTKQRIYKSIKKILKNRPVAFNNGQYTSFSHAIVEYTLVN